MADPRIAESSIREAVNGIDELEFIDRGGQGDAWRLRRNGGPDEVLKAIIGAESARVAQEIGTMEAVDSPHVMGFTEAGKLAHGGTNYPFIIGEYVPGRAIGVRLEADEWPDEKQALAAMIGALRGIAAIHANEIVHRDVKPGNIALRDDDWSKPVIPDLGLGQGLVAKRSGEDNDKWGESWQEVSLTLPSRRMNACGSSCWTSETVNSPCGAPGSPDIWVNKTDHLR